MKILLNKGMVKSGKYQYLSDVNNSWGATTHLSTWNQKRGAPGREGPPCGVGEGGAGGARGGVLKIFGGVWARGAARGRAGPGPAGRGVF
jgi:hypothetical protein